MSERTAYQWVWTSLIASMLLGGSIVVFSLVWLPANQAASVDLILTPDELHDRKNVEIVGRTHRYNAASQSHLTGPYFFLGSLIVGTSVIGMVGMRWWPSPFVDGKRRFLQ